MKLLVFSLTGNSIEFAKRFEERTGIGWLDMKTTDAVSLNEDYVAIVPSYDETINDIMRDFFDDSRKHLVGMASSGDKNFADAYGWACTLLADEYSVPVLSMFEKHGQDSDIEELYEAIKKL